jgi:hypothetical protein
MVSSGVNQKVVDSINIGPFYEFCFSLKSTIMGKINSIIVKIPDVNTAVGVPLWDLKTGTVIKSEIVNVPGAAVTIEKANARNTLIKDKEYFISVNNDDWFIQQKK